MTTLALSPDQKQAIDAVMAWWSAGSVQSFSLAGYAGTGKTTVISHLIERFGRDHVLVAAPTGKAALRLRQNGVHASTIHQVAYRYEGSDAAGNPEFEFRGIDVDRDAVVIVDESSMINSDIHRDLLSTKQRFLFVGDHGQLPPVGGDPGVMRNPDFVLQQIHRQNDTGLLAFAHALREGVYVPEATGDAVAKHWLHPMHGIDAAGKERLMAADVVICHLNRTRHDLNHRMMRQLGLAKLTRTASDAGTAEVLRLVVDKPCRVVGLKNDYKLGIYNGQSMVMTVTDLSESFAIADLETDTGVTMHGVTVSLAGFGRNPQQDEAVGGTALLDFGYALTAHKAQGSEWDRVVVWDDTYSRMEDRARWCYTAATRAKHRLDWIHR